MEYKTILITGISGYLAGYVSKALLKEGYHVIGLSACSTPSKKSCCYSLPIPKIKRYFLDQTPLQQIFTENKIDAVIHLATAYGRNKETIEQIVNANVSFPVSVLEQAIKSKVPFFINTDTILAKNLNPYSLTKSHFSDWLELYKKDISCVNIRLDHFYGPNENPVKFVAYLFESLCNNVDEIQLTQGTQLRYFTYIEDVVNAYVTILKNLDHFPKGNTYSLDASTQEQISIKELALLLKKKLNNNKTLLSFGKIPFRANEVLLYNVDNSALKKLGWRTKFTIEKGLDKLIALRNKK